MLIAQWKVKENGFELEKGEPYEVIDAGSKSYFSSSDELVAFKKEDLTIHTQVFDPSVPKQVAYNENVLEEKHMGFESFLQFGGDYYVVYNWWDEERKKERIYSREVDLETASLKEAEKIFETEVRLKGDRVRTPGLFGGKKVEDKLSFDFSKNGKWALAYYFPEEAPENEHRVGFMVFDEEMELEWDTIRTLPYEKGRMSSISYEISNEGRVYMISEVEEKSEGEDREGPGYRYEIFRIGPGSGEDLQHAKLDLEEMYVKSYMFGASGGRKKDHLRFYGYYNLHEESDHRKGIFLYTIDREGDVKGPYQIPFSMGIVNRFEDEELREQNQEKGSDHPDVGLKWLGLENSFVFDNGDLLLVGEEYYYKKRRRSGSNPHTYPKGSYRRNQAQFQGSGEVYYTYHYENVLAALISPSGELKWMKKLPKNQIGGRVKRDDASFHFLKGDEFSYLVFFDHKDNLRLESDEVPTQHICEQGGILSAYRLKDADGTVSKIRILDVKDVNGGELYQYGLHRFMSGNDDNLFFEVYKKGKEDVLFRVGF